MRKESELGRILKGCAALMLVAACAKAQPSKPPEKEPGNVGDTLSIHQGKSVPVSGEMEIQLFEIVRKRVPPKRREVLRAHLRIRVSSRESDLHIRSDGSWKSVLGWEFRLVGGSDSLATVVVRREKSFP